jgi:DNA-binding beta-propeller fold protein YncE
MVFGAAVVALAVVAALVVVLPGGKPAPTHDRLTARTLLRLPAVSAVAQLGSRYWATDDIRDVLVQFDPTSGRTLATVHLNGRPVAMIADAGDLWVANMVSNTVQEVSPQQRRVIRTIAVPSGPSGLAVEDGRLWLTSITAGSVSAIEPSTGALGAAVPLTGGAVRIAAGFNALWVTGTSDELTELQPGANGSPDRLDTVRVGSGPIGVATGEGSVWVADTTAGTVARVDPVTRHVLHTYRIGGDPLAVSVADGRVWVADGSGQTLRTVFPGAGLSPLNLAAGPRTLLAVGTAMWVATSNPGRVLAVGVSSRP